jgi:hypothetical protein
LACEETDGGTESETAVGCNAFDGASARLDLAALSPEWSIDGADGSTNVVEDEVTTDNFDMTLLLPTTSLATLTVSLRISDGDKSQKIAVALADVGTGSVSSKPFVKKVMFVREGSGALSFVDNAGTVVVNVKTGVVTINDGGNAGVQLAYVVTQTDGADLTGSMYNIAGVFQSGATGQLPGDWSKVKSVDQAGASLQSVGRIVSPPPTPGTPTAIAVTYDDAGTFSFSFNDPTGGSVWIEGVFPLLH